MDDGIGLLKTLRQALLPQTSADIRLSTHHDLAWALGERALTLTGTHLRQGLEAALRESDAAMAEIEALLRPRLPFTCGDLELKSGDDYQPVPGCCCACFCSARTSLPQTRWTPIPSHCWREQSRRSIWGKRPMVLRSVGARCFGGSRRMLSGPLGARSKS